MVKNKKTDYKKLTDDVVDVINSSFSYKAAIKAKEQTEALSHSRWTVPFDLFLVDTLIGGGLSEGKILRLYGDPGAGKTTLMYWMLLSAMDRGAICVFFDPEVSFDHDRLAVLAKTRGIKIDPGRLLIAYPDHIDDLFKQAYQFMGGYHPVPKSYSSRPTFKEPLVLFVDTISNVPTKGEYDHMAAMRDHKKHKKVEGMMGRARILRLEMRRVRKQLGLYGAAMVLNEQSMASFNMFGPSKTTSGGDAFKFGSDTSIVVGASSAFQDEETNETVGQIVRIRSEKARKAKPKGTVEIPLYYDTGFDEIESLYLFLENHGLLPRSGTRIVLSDGKDEIKFYGKNKKDHIYEERWSTVIRELVEENIGKIWTKKSKG